MDCLFYSIFHQLRFPDKPKHPNFTKGCLSYYHIQSTVYSFIELLSWKPNFAEWVITLFLWIFNWGLHISLYKMNTHLTFKLIITSKLNPRNQWKLVPTNNNELTVFYTLPAKSSIFSNLRIIWFLSPFLSFFSVTWYTLLSYPFYGHIRQDRNTLDIVGPSQMQNWTPTSNSQKKLTNQHQLSISGKSINRMEVVNSRQFYIYIFSYYFTHNLWISHCINIKCLNIF